MQKLILVKDKIMLIKDKEKVKLEHNSNIIVTHMSKIIRSLVTELSL